MPLNHFDLAPGARRAILLQGPVGAFFARLQDHLDGAGWSTVKINFNSGDVLFHGRGHEISYTEALEDWPRYFEGLLENVQADVVLLFGDQRPIHAMARQVARAKGVSVVCFEEGYLRPDYLTMELDGNNAASPLRKWRADQVPSAPEPEPPHAMPNNGFADMARSAARYYTALRAGASRFPNYRHHRERGVVRETLLWARNSWRKWRWSKPTLHLIHDLIDRCENRYWIVALQVHDDLQLRRHGCGWTVEKLIESSIASFARSAPRDHALVLKGHPLDRGHTAGRELTRKIAALHQVADRVHYVDDGSLGLLSRCSRGMVTINSTSAMLSFSHGKPVLALGDCMYEGLIANGSDRSPAAMDRFWRVAPAFEPDRWLAFRAHMIAESQVNGSFYIETQISATCARVAARLDRLVAQADAAGRPALRDHGAGDGVVVSGRFPATRA
jgi:capsular polysaccharide export protein